jgi:hypothetical protein
MVGKTIGKRIDEGQIPVYVERFGGSREEIFVTSPELKLKYGDRFASLPSGAIGVFPFQRLNRVSASSRPGPQVRLNYITRDDIAA